MNKSFIIKLIFLFFLSTSYLFAQDTAVFREINTQVWENFEKAFRTNDPILLNSLHTNDVVRIPADSRTIIAGEEYFKNQLKSFKWSKDNGYHTSMYLRFTERINYDKYASEKGIFKLVVSMPDSAEHAFYGAFHMLLIKQNNIWKISMDYDTSNNGKINENSFENAYDMWDFKPFYTDPDEQ